MIQAYQRHFPNINVTGILADALYGDANFMDRASSVFSGIQVVSQLRWNQLVIYKNKEVKLKAYFDSYLGPGVKKNLVIRGGKEQKVTVLSARLKVKAHGQKRFIVALKYEGEDD
ncbi:hypothetical protein, partial [Endozoicomonas acroporae]|uniref:hypothetical protein n=1 Tax=Endozoicomonas acroporae TaxID=1701104 RepID=UPI003D7ADCF5